MQSNKIENQSQKRTNHIRKLVMTALMAALSSVLMFFSFNDFNKGSIFLICKSGSPPEKVTPPPVL